MFKSKSILTISIIFLLIAFYLLSFKFNNWLSLTMPRHQLIQLPSMLLIGILLALNFKFVIKDLYWAIAVLIFSMSSFIFWMLPHSIDYAVININFNRAMHINIMLCGFLLTLVFKKLIVEIRILFLGMVVAMLLSTGITLKVFNILLCSSFTIAQQKQTGLYLIIIAIALFVFTAISLFRFLKNGR